MPKNPLGNWLGENRDLFIKGYFANRIAKGDLPDTREPLSRLPTIPAGASMEVMEVETGFLAALRAEEQKKLQKE